MPSPEAYAVFFDMFLQLYQIDVTEKADGWPSAVLTENCASFVVSLLPRALPLLSATNRIRTPRWSCRSFRSNLVDSVGCCVPRIVFRSDSNKLQGQEPRLGPMILHIIINLNSLHASMLLFDC